MYFVNDEHESNFVMLVQLYKADRDPEYKTACYVLALPDIYRKTGGRFGENPFDWVYKFAETKEEREDYFTKEKYTLIDRQYETDKDGKELHSEAYGVLSSSERCIVDLGMNLFTGSTEFNLAAALGTWGDSLFKVYQQSVQIRIDREVK